MHNPPERESKKNRTTGTGWPLSSKNSSQIDSSGSIHQPPYDFRRAAYCWAALNWHFALFLFFPTKMNEAAALHSIYESASVKINLKWNVGVALETRWGGLPAVPTHSLTCTRQKRYFLVIFITRTFCFRSTLIHQHCLVSCPLIYLQTLLHTWINTHIQWIEYICLCIHESVCCCVFCTG